MNLSQLLRSFAVGFAGFAHAVRSEQNLRWHCLAAVCVVGAGFVFAIAAWEWLIVVLAIGLVLSAECMNTAIERLADQVTRETQPLIQQAKDCSSAAVLVLALTAAIVGAIIFLPKIWTSIG